MWDPAVISFLWPEINAGDRFLPVIPPPLQYALTPCRFKVTPAPIKALPLLSRPSLFPFSMTPPGRAIAYWSSAHLQASPVDSDLASEPRASSSPLSPPLSLAPPLTFFVWFNSQQIEPPMTNRSSSPPRATPAASPPRCRMQSSTSTKLPRPPWRTEARRGNAVTQNSSKAC
jgi:hypothetical protein